MVVALISVSFTWPILRAEMTNTHHALNKSISVSIGVKLVTGIAGMTEGSEADRLTGWSDPHVLLAVQHEAAHWLALGTVRCSLAH